MSGTHKMTLSLFTRGAARLLISGLCAVLSTPAARAARPFSDGPAIWVYPDPAQPANNPVLNEAGGQLLVADARASSVNLIFLSVYSSTPNSNGRYMYDETLIANFVAAAHLASMRVYAAYGAPDWPPLGCGTPGSPSFPIQRLQEIVAYNATNPSILLFDSSTSSYIFYPGTFDGVILDVEPSTADQNLLNLYTCSQQTLSPHSIGLSVAISAFWNDPIGSGPPAYRQILDMGFDNVVVMGYR